MGTRATPLDDGMLPAETDVSKANRGKFYWSGTRISLPVYLDDQAQATLCARASAKGVELSALVNVLLHKDIELFEMGR